ncbi:collagen alpha-5(VI) chain-like [Littorina saxatilis]|uniref:VWFA domain-containing protein n=1 Tax=Littorina saxatilis TaxID=31220 RepID=A0AAN9B604_9CAEN
MYRIAAAVIVIVLAVTQPSVGQTECNTTLDAMFVLDGSNSINKVNYERMVDAVVASLPNFDIRAEHIRMGFVAYSDALSLKFTPLTDDVNQLRTQLQAVREWPDGTTDTHQALLRATLELNTRQRSGVPQVIVIMTDGQSNYPDGTMTAVAIAEANNITIVSVGIGPENNQQELVDMATDENKDVFKFENFTGAIQRVQSLAKVTCKVPCQEGIDLMFVLDGSNSVNIFNYRKTLTAIKDTSLSFWNAYPNSRIGLITYASGVDSVIPPTNDMGALEKITDLEYPDGSTTTAEAIVEATKQLRANQRAGVVPVIVVITDGRSDDPVATQLASLAAKDNNMTIYSIGVGEQIDMEELGYISSDTRRSYVANNFSTLATELTGLVKNVCKDAVTTTTPTPTTPYVPPKADCKEGVDLMFVLDGSNSVNIFNYRKTLEAIKNTSFSFWNEYSNSRIGLVTYASGVDSVIPLTNDTTALQSITDLEYPDGSTTTAEAIVEATKQLLANQRTGISPVIVVITDGKSDDPVATQAAAFSAKDNNITIYAIGVGPQIDDDELGMISSNIRRSYVVDSFASLATELTQLVKNVCNDQGSTPSGIAITTTMSSPVTIGPPLGGVCNRTLDVMFVIDSSSDVGEANFRTMTSAVSQVARYFVNSPSGNSRVGVITYSTNVTGSLGLRTRTTLNNDIQNLPYTRGTRATSLALQQAARVVLSSKRNTVPFAVVVLIAGRSNNPTSAAVSAQLLVAQSRGSVSVLEITNAVDTSETSAMALNIDTRRARADTYSQVTSQLSNLADNVCRTA